MSEVPAESLLSSSFFNRNSQFLVRIAKVAYHSESFQQDIMSDDTLTS